MAFGLSLWGPADPADYLAFTPGELVGLRAGWPKGSDPTLVFVSTKDLKNAFFNAQYQVDVTQVAPK